MIFDYHTLRYKMAVDRVGYGAAYSSDLGDRFMYNSVSVLC